MSQTPQSRIGQPSPPTAGEASAPAFQDGWPYRQLEVGDRVGSMYVVARGADTLILKARRRSAILNVLVYGTVALIAGTLALYGWYRFFFDNWDNLNFEGLAMYSLGTLICGWMAVSHMGLQMTFDRVQKTFRRQWLLNLFDKSWSTENLRGVQLLVEPHGRTMTGRRYHVCQLSLLDAAAPMEAIVITKQAVSERESHRLILAALEISRLLSLRIDVAGDTRVGTELFNAAMERVGL